MRQYLVFLRGINVGGKSLIKMSSLRDCLMQAGFKDVSTYIQSGNVILCSELADKNALANNIASSIKNAFGLDVLVAVFSKEEWQSIISEAPSWWGKDEKWRHNILIAIRPEGSKEIEKGIGPLKPDIEKLVAGNGVLYQSILIEAIGRGSTGSKLVSSSVYRNITVRNYNTATKLGALLNTD